MPSLRLPPHPRLTRDLYNRMESIYYDSQLITTSRV